MSDKHYTQVPQDLFDQAITWLGKELGVVGEAVKPPHPAADAGQKLGLKVKRRRREVQPPQAGDTHAVDEGK